MKQQGHVVDEVVCFILLRLCFNSLRNAWLPGGYPPKKDASKVRLHQDPSSLSPCCQLVAEAHPLHNCIARAGRTYAKANVPLAGALPCKAQQPAQLGTHGKPRSRA